MFLSKPTCISYSCMFWWDCIKRFTKMHVLYHLPFICLFCNLIRKVKKAIIWLDLSFLSLFVLLLMVPLLQLRKIIFFTPPLNAFIICLLFIVLISLALPVIVTKHPQKWTLPWEKMHLHNGDKVCGKKPRNRTQGIANFIPKSASSDLNKLCVLKRSSAARSTNQPDRALQHSLSFNHMKSPSWLQGLLKCHKLSTSFTEGKKINYSKSQASFISSEGLPPGDGGSKNTKYGCRCRWGALKSTPGSAQASSSHAFFCYASWPAFIHIPHSL